MAALFISLVVLVCCVLKIFGFRVRLILIEDVNCDDIWRIRSNVNLIKLLAVRDGNV